MWLEADATVKGFCFIATGGNFERFTRGLNDSENGAMRKLSKCPENHPDRRKMIGVNYIRNLANKLSRYRIRARSSAVDGGIRPKDSWTWFRRHTNLENRLNCNRFS